MRTLIILLSLFASTLAIGQVSKIHIKKDDSPEQTYLDTAYFDLRKFALYLKVDTLKYFENIKQYKVEYKSKKKSGTLLIQGNSFPQSFKTMLVDLRVKRIDFTFSNIELIEAGPNNKTKKCASFTSSIYKTKTHRQLYGAGTRFVFRPIYSIIYN